MFMRAIRSFSTGRGMVKVGNILPEDHEMVSKYSGHFEPFDPVSGGMIQQATSAPGELSTASRSQDEGEGGEGESGGSDDNGDTTAGEDGDGDGPEQPAKNASKAVWVAFALEAGVDVTGLGRDEIAALFE